MKRDCAVILQSRSFGTCFYDITCTHKHRNSLEGVNMSELCRLELKGWGWEGWGWEGWGWEGWGWEGWWLLRALGVKAGILKESSILVLGGLAPYTMCWHGHVWELWFPHAQRVSGKMEYKFNNLLSQRSGLNYSRLQKSCNKEVNCTKPQYNHPVLIDAGSLVLIVQLWFCTISLLLQQSVVLVPIKKIKIELFHVEFSLETWYVMKSERWSVQGFADSL